MDHKAEDFTSSFSSGMNQLGNHGYFPVARSSNYATLQAVKLPWIYHYNIDTNVQSISFF